MHERARLAGHAWGVVALAIGCTLGAYVVVRAWALSFTHDESITYNRYAHAPFFSMLLSHGTDANNHPLNTLAMQFANATFGSSEIALRWSSVAAFVVYIIALGAVLRRVSRV